MSISKKHFKVLAENIGRAFKNCSKLEAEDREIILNEVMDFCKEFNGLFDKGRFEEAVLKVESGEAELEEFNRIYVK